MKSRYPYVVIAILGITLSQGGCRTETDEPLGGADEAAVAFALSVVDAGKAGGVRLKALSNVTAVEVTIEDAEGYEIYNKHRIDIFPFNGSYASDPISMVPGSYTLTHFHALDATGEPLYMTPQEGSLKAHLVANPAPIAFSVSTDTVTTVVPELVSTANATPESFGYTSFSLDDSQVIPTFDFLVAAFVFDSGSGNPMMSDASITITNENGDPLYVGALLANTNQLIVQDGHAQYNIVISKAGYIDYSNSFTAAELKTYFSSSEQGPLEAFLQKMYTSCLDVLNAGASVGDGIYTIDPDGDGVPTDVHCDMTVDGGGWTLVASMARDNNAYWTWNNRDFLRFGNAYGDLQNAFTQDYQSNAWHQVTGNAILFKADNLDTKYLRYDSIITGETVASKFPLTDQVIVGTFTADVSVGSWFQQCGTDFGMRLWTPDSDANGWIEANAGFAWKSSSNDGCDWDDGAGGLTNANNPTLEMWAGGMFYDMNISTAMNVFVR